MSSEQDASSIPDGSHLIALTSFCKTTHVSMNVHRVSMDWSGIMNEEQYRKKPLPCDPGTSWEADRCQVDIHGCTCLCYRRQRWCCSASRHQELELWSILNILKRPHSLEELGDFQLHKTIPTEQETFCIVIITLPEWKGNCCLASPVCASQMIVVWKNEIEHFWMHNYKQCGTLKTVRVWNQQIHLTKLEGRVKAIAAAASVLVIVLGACSTQESSTE